jgi:DNA-binding NarL/FixJ family response regulator
MQGGAPMTPSIAARVLSFFREQQQPIAGSYALTEKEKMVLQHLVQGMSYKMIADKCGISYHTVNTHIKKIYEKLHVHSVSEAVAKALSEKIVIP